MREYLLSFGGKGRIVKLQKRQAENSVFALDLMRNFASEATGQGNRLEYARMSRLHEDQVIKGIPFFCGADSRAGAWFELVALPETTREQIIDATAELMRKRDVASLSVTRITELI